MAVFRTSVVISSADGFLAYEFTRELKVLSQLSSQSKQSDYKGFNLRHLNTSYFSETRFKLVLFFTDFNALQSEMETPAIFEWSQFTDSKVELMKHSKQYHIGN